MTEWRAIPGYEGRYEVSDDGQVRSLDNRQTYMRQGKEVRRTRPGRVLRPDIDDDGYPRVGLHAGRGAKPRTIAVHLVVLFAFVGPRPTGMVARHLDGDSLNARLSNLMWGTLLENAADALRHGAYLVGEKSPASKLTEDAVRAIRTERTRTGILAARYGVAKNTIRTVRDGKTWKHVA